MTTESEYWRMRIGLALSLIDHLPPTPELIEEVRLALLGATVEDLVRQRKDREVIP